MRRGAVALVFISLAASAWSATPVVGDPRGRWNREDGLGGIDITECGDALCGRIVWLRDRGTPAYVGQLVLFDMRPVAADSWTGSANNPEDGRTYAGTMTLAGERLLTRGCVFGGLICKSIALTRSR